MQSGEIFSAISKVMHDVGSIAKGRKNTMQNYSFRGIEDMYNSIQPALIKHGVFCCPQVVKVDSQEFRKSKDGKEQVSFRVLLTVCHKFFASDGSCIDVITVGEGIDTSDKASNKAMSAAMKYAFIQLLSIPTEDIEDSDRSSPGVGDEDGFNNFLGGPVASAQPAKVNSLPAGPAVAPTQPRSVGAAAARKHFTF